MDFLILTVYKGLIYRSSSLKKVPSDMVWYLGQPFYQRGPGCVASLKFDFEVKLATSYQNQNSILFFHNFFFEKLGQKNGKSKTIAPY